MKRHILLACLLFGASLVNAQSAFRGFKALAPSRITGKTVGFIAREMRVSLGDVALANQTLRASNAQIVNIKGLSEKIKTPWGKIPLVDLRIDARIPVTLLGNPSTYYGPYSYLTRIREHARYSGAVTPRFQSRWDEIVSPPRFPTYNGVHHIVNKTTLEQIYNDMAKMAQAQNKPFLISLTQMQNNAPASFHPLHGVPEHSIVFHNARRQLLDYQKGGIKQIITTYFDDLIKLHAKFPRLAPAVPKKTITNTLLEGELFARTFGLKWE